jgi:hypothetical protein
MGNLCSTSKNEAEPFSRPGRVLGSPANPPPNTAPRAPLPAKSKAPFKSPGRTLGEPAPEVPDAARADARTNAAIAAQVSDGPSPLMEIACHTRCLANWRVPETSRVGGECAKGETRVETGGTKGSDAGEDLERSE